MENLPRHIAIIMDGNGRWAKKRGLPRKLGHAQGAKTFLRCVDDCRDIGIEYLTVYAFSTENWKRPKDEVDALMKLFEKHLDDLKTTAQKNTRLLFIGDISALNESLKSKIAQVTETTKNNTGLTVTIAINYGGRDEILNAAKSFAQRCKDGAADIYELDENSFGKYMYAGDMPPVDLMIRPSGEQRISNFLLWQSAYAELVFMDVLWPDFTKKDLEKAIDEYSQRNRRFGGI